MKRTSAPIGTATALLLPVLAAQLAVWYARFLLAEPGFRGVVVRPERWDAWSAAPRSTAITIPILATILIGSAVGLIGSRWRSGSWRIAAGSIGRACAPFLVLPVHQALLLFAQASGDPSVIRLAVAAAPWLLSVVVAGWLAGLWHAVASRSAAGAQWAITIVVLCAGLYTFVFAGLATLQYRALLVPHGDTAMYEEHLWNVLAGKGFKSQLDGGRSFLGEHVQLIHLVLLPIYALAPSMVTLFMCESAALASGSIAVYLLVRRAGPGPRAAALFAIAYLLFFPLQYLDLEVTWKSFRPTTFGVPIVLFACTAIEYRRYFAMVFFLFLALLVQEEYALVVAGLGAFVLFRRGEGRAWRRRLLGASILMFAALWLALALVAVIPHYRHGSPPHYTPYFGSLGESPARIVGRLAGEPGLLAQQLLRERNIELVTWSLVPLFFLPLASPARFAVALPIYGYLMAGDLPFLSQPWFHFHAPLVPILFWSAAGGLGNLGGRIDSLFAARLVVAMCLVTGFLFGRSPLSMSFYDPLAGVPVVGEGAARRFEPTGSYAPDLYLPGERSAAFEALFEGISLDERVAATDYVRARFTHHRAAHDYPLRPHVSIDEVDVIVLDVQEGWWGRGATNPDRALLACLSDEDGRPGTRFTIRGRPFAIIHHDRYFLAARQRR